MRRFLTLTLALLMALVTAGAAGAKAVAFAEEENPYVGLWEVTGGWIEDHYIGYEDVKGMFYLDFLPNGAIYIVMIDGEEVNDDYLAYVITGENTLDLYEGGDALSANYSPDIGVISVETGDSEHLNMTFLQRVEEDPLPDIRAMAANPDEEQTYYCYTWTEGDQTVSILEWLPAMGMGPEDIYLTLAPDGTGYVQFGSEDAGGEITWTETEFIPVEPPNQPAAYTREGDHILLSINESTNIEFAPEGEVEALMAMLGIEIAEPAEGGDIDPEAVVGEWKLADMGQELTMEQIEAQGLNLTFRFNADGSAVMISKGKETEGLHWAVEDDELTLSLRGYDLFTFTYDGEHLLLSIGAQIYFEKVA